MLKQIITSRIVNILLVVSLSTQSILAAAPVNAESAYIPDNSNAVINESSSNKSSGFFGTSLAALAKWDDFIFSIFRINNNDNTIQEYNPNDLIQNKDLFGYMPGEIIVKFKNSNAVPQTENAIQNQMDLEFDTSNIDTEAVIPVLEEKKQGLHMNSSEDYVAVQKAKIVGLDRMYNIDIPDLQRKSELFIERFKIELSKLPPEQMYEGVDQRIVSVPTQEFGIVSIDISNQEYIIDPFTLQLLDELRGRSDIEYAEVNARVFLNNDIIVDPAPQESQDLQEDLQEVEIPIDVPVDAPKEIIKEDPEEVLDPIELPVEDPEEIIEDEIIEEDESIFDNIVEVIEDAVDLIVAPIQEVIEDIIEPSASEDPVDAFFEEQWALNNTGQNYHYSRDYLTSGTDDVDINFLETYKEPAYNKGEGVVVAVIDSGISYIHQEIDDNLWINQSEIPDSLFILIDKNSDGEVTSREIITYVEDTEMDINLDGEYNFKDVLDPSSDFVNGIDEDGDGYADDILGYDFVSYESSEDGRSDSGKDNDPYDWHGHGTHVSGTIAAEANEEGIIGIAPKAKIMAVRGLGQNGGSYSDLIESVYYAANHGADIINNSWGGRGSLQSLADAFDYASSMGVVSVAASGNSYENVIYHTPANIDSVISVGNHTSWNERRASSNFGSTLDIAAPGTYIISLLSKGSYFEREYQSSIYDGYLIITGTSMASPHIAGILAGIQSSSSVEIYSKSSKSLKYISKR